MNIINPVANLTQISTRSHSDLQNLTANDHLQYSSAVGLLSARPAAGVAGRYYFATDNGRDYRDNGVSWDELSIKEVNIALANLGTRSFLNLSDVPASYAGSTLTALRVNAGGTALEFANPSTVTGIYSATGAIFQADDGVVTVTGTTNTKVKEIACGSTMPTTTLSIYFELKALAANTAIAQIYKNGVAYGTLRSTTNLAFVPYTEALSFSASDLIQIFMHDDTPGYQVQVQNFRILGAVAYHQYQFVNNL